MDPADVLAAVGGTSGIALTVDELYRELLDDPVVAPYFDGIDVPRVRRHMGEFLISALGGPQQYRGRDLSLAHTGLDVTDDAFDRTVAHLVGALERRGMSPEMVTHVVSGLAVLRPSITGAPSG